MVATRIKFVSHPLAASPILARLDVRKRITDAMIGSVRTLTKP